MTQPMMKTLMKVMADSAAIENGAEMPPPPSTFDARLVVDDVEFVVDDAAAVDVVVKVGVAVAAAGRLRFRPTAGKLNAGRWQTSVARITSVSNLSQVAGSGLAR